MNKKARHTWLILVALVFAFVLLLLLLLCRGCGLFKEDNVGTEQTDKTTVAGMTDDQITQEAADELQPSISVSFDDVALDEEKTRPDTVGTAQGGQTTTPPSTGPNATTPSTVPTEQTKPPAADAQPDVLSYEKYMAMSAREQQQFFDDNFKDDPIAFAQWFQKIKQEYEKENPPIIVTGPINMEDYLN